MELGYKRGWTEKDDVRFDYMFNLLNEDIFPYLKRKFKSRDVSGKSQYRNAQIAQAFVLYPGGILVILLTDDNMLDFELILNKKKGYIKAFGIPISKPISAQQYIKELKKVLLDHWQEIRQNNANEIEHIINLQKAIIKL